MLTDERFSVTLSGGRRSVGQALNNELDWKPKR
ncbi:cytochrome P450 [Sphaerisporangium sp. NBC_01403]